MNRTVAYVAPLLSLAGLTAASQTAKNEPLVDMETRMAEIGRAISPTFSPDGTRVAFGSDRTDVPQVWVTGIDGGTPVQITKGDDPIGRVAWSPSGEWLAMSIGPGGGMNTQIYVVHPDGSGLHRLTDGGKETNNLGQWTHDGRRITMGSNRSNPSTIDAYLVDPATAARD